MSLGKHILKVANKCIATGGHATTDIMIKWADDAAKLEEEIEALEKQRNSILDEFRLYIDEDSNTAEWIDAYEEAIRNSKSRHVTLKGDDDD